MSNRCQQVFARARLCCRAEAQLDVRKEKCVRRTCFNIRADRNP